MGNSHCNHLRLTAMAVAFVTLANTAFAQLMQSFVGTNTTGNGTNFTFTIPAAVTNMSVTVTNNGSAYSYLMLSKGVAATDTAYDFASKTGSSSNYVNIELPELVATNWYARVSTPSGAPSHAFTLTIETNRTDLRTIRPVTKPLFFTNALASINQNSWHYFRVEAPSNMAFKIVLESSTVAPDLYIQRGALPTTSTSLKKSVNSTNDVLALSDGQFTTGTYFIGVNAGAAASYTLRTEPVTVTTLNWDPGTNDEGSPGYVYTNQTAVETDFFFKIRTQTPANGGWRTALNLLTTNNANVYLSKGPDMPTPSSATFKSERAGSDGFVIGTSQFNSGEDWYITVHATAGASFTLLSGQAYVIDMGSIAADDSSSTNLTMGPEGWRFFRFTASTEVLGWRLWLTNATNSTIFIKKTGVPLSGASELSQANNMLVVPPYLTSGSYFVGVSNAPGALISLDSRQQIITDIPFTVGTSAFVTNMTMTGYGFITFRVALTNQIAWQIDLTPSSGNADVYVRSNVVANKEYNDAYSELFGPAVDNLSLVAPDLRDGTFFITVYTPTNTATNTFTLRSGPATITDIDYVAAVTNDEPDRVGWRYYRVMDINQQNGSLGWDMLLTNDAPGTRIVLRMNTPPSIINARPNTNSVTYKLYTIPIPDTVALTNYLQDPGHQAGIWYIGVYNSTNYLTNFTLITREFPTTEITPSNQTFTITEQPSGKWQFFKLDFSNISAWGGEPGGPAEILGWDLRLVNVTSGAPKMVVKRLELPKALGNVNLSPETATNWPYAAQWAPEKDWTDRGLSANGTNEAGRVLAMGMGRPLEASTYYIGVIDATTTNPASYTLSSRFIGYNRPIPVNQLDYAGGMATNTSLAPREADYYHVYIPPGKHSWKVKLQMISGEAMMVVSTNKIPNIVSEQQMQKTNNEHFLLMPNPGQTDPATAFIGSGDYYIAVIGEGVSPSDKDHVGTGTSSYVLQSVGEMPETDLGDLTDELAITNSLEGGEIAVHHFTTSDVNLLGFEVRLERLSGTLEMALRTNLFLLHMQDPYGSRAGESANVARCTAVNNIGIINIAKNAGWGASWTISVQAQLPYADASYVLHVRRYIPIPVAFDGGTCTISNQVGSWSFFELDLRTNGNALGWDLRLSNVSGGSPKIAIGREILPILGSTTVVNPGGATNWPVGGQWLADKDWADRRYSATGLDESGRIIAMGMHRPLEPGLYYVSVSTNCTIQSRGIGPGYTIPIQDLQFEGSGAIVTNTLPAREAAFYRVEIPEDTRSWKVRLSAVAGEVSLIESRRDLPNVLAKDDNLATSFLTPGKRMKKVGDDHFLLLPGAGQTNIPSGTYWLTVVSDGVSPTSDHIGTGSSTYVLESQGALQFTDLGYLGPVDLVQTGAVAGGECIGYQFTVPEGTLSMEAQLENRVGNPTMALHAGPYYPNPGFALGGETYGNDGGEQNGTDVHASYLSVANPTPGIYYIIVKARQTNTTSIIAPDASFNLRLTAVTAPPINFNGGSVTVTNHSPSKWRYFQINVDSNALGMDLRLTNVTAGVPKLVMCRGFLPNSTAASWSNPGSFSSWPLSNSWAAVTDWSGTSRQNGPTGVDERYRILAMGMYRPLEPGGPYYIGVYNSATTNATYKISCRGIGPGFSIPIVDVPFTNGIVTNLALPPREAAYFRVVVPSNSPSWKVKITGTYGEVMAVALANRVPNVDYNAINRSISQGRLLQKPGNEHLIVLPVQGQTSIPAGTNYFAVVGEGVNPNTGANQIGTGSSDFIFNSFGSVPIDGLGDVTSSGISRDHTLDSGELKAYQFNVPPGNIGVEVKLEGVVGAPAMVLQPGDYLPNPVAGTGDDYGTEGGYNWTYAHPTLITLPNPDPGLYSLVVKARKVSNTVYPDAVYSLRVHDVVTPELNFGSYLNTNGLSNTVSGVLEDNQRAFFMVNVPSTINGAPILGWKVEVRQSSGTAWIRVRKGTLPSDNQGNTNVFTTSGVYIVPPYLTNGTWYVEVKGQNSTAFTLTSSPIELERVWTLPALGDTNPPSGLTFPDFGDSGIDTNGAPVAGDYGIPLDAGFQHYYGVIVSTQNVGLMHVDIKSIAGNHDVYVRTNFLPTVTHDEKSRVTGTMSVDDTIYDRSMVFTTNEHAAWVPLSNTTESQLKPGLWCFTVRGVLSGRYRLQLSTGKITDISLTNTYLTDQDVLGNDWRYYRLQMPTAVPLTWKVAFGTSRGTVKMYVRDTVPPGLGTKADNIIDWNTNPTKNNGPYASGYSQGTNTFTTPPTRPGETYYLGFCGSSDATFWLSVWTNGAPVYEPPLLAFDGGRVDNVVIPAYGQLAYRIDAPADAARLKILFTNQPTVSLYVEQGTLPKIGGTVHWQASSQTSPTMNQYLSGAWPWLPGKSYFLVLSNTFAAPNLVSTIIVNGRSVTNDDDDGDLMLDAWERYYWGNTNQTATADADGDGVNNYYEFLEGTVPTNTQSFNPRLSTLVMPTNVLGRITNNPPAAYYPMNSVVMVTAVATNSAYAFAYWGGQASGYDNPLALVMNTNKTITATFKVIGDDLSMAVPLSGRSTNVAGTNVGATKESGEPGLANNKSIWWKWTAPNSGTVTIDTAGSALSTVLTVYTGTGFSNFVTVASATTAGSVRAKATFNAVAGTTYFISVEGTTSSPNTIALSLNLSGGSQIAAPFVNINGSFQCTLQGDANANYRWEASTNLTNWVLIQNVTNSAGGTLPLTDPEATNFMQRFYRMRTP